MGRELSKAELDRLARLGAGARLEELDRERRAILQAFPGLAFKRHEAPAAEPRKKPRKKRRKATAAERKAASERMRKYWAAKKQQA